MKTEDYEAFTDTTDRSPKQLWYYGLGISGEAGETSDKIKKAYRLAGLNGGAETVLEHLDRDGLIAELGDTLWYLVRIARTLGVSLEEIMSANEAKLNGRRDRGTIVGEGDKR
jgi:NTP pyrophosphatase (non-canonical NTP hydrolase)